MPFAFQICHKKSNVLSLSITKGYLQWLTTSIIYKQRCIFGYGQIILLFQPYAIKAASETPITACIIYKKEDSTNLLT
jgi:hypothetical protein